MYDLKKTGSILLLYAKQPSKNAATITEHIEAFIDHFPEDVVVINTVYGFPEALVKYEFPLIILHYSLFGSFPFQLCTEFTTYLRRQRNSHKVAFFQDEMSNCQQRFSLINSLSIRTVYSILSPNFYYVYYENTDAEFVFSTLTGYVSSSLISEAKVRARAAMERPIDVVYRARPLPYFMGKGAQEKINIADGFLQLAASTTLKCDVKTGETDRIYGDRWLDFLASAKFALGVESGTSIFDLEGKVEELVDAYLLGHPNAEFSDVSRNILEPFEGIIEYRAISPRIFECAATKTCMILFEGEYQNIITPNVHYIPLRKDFSNFDEVVSKMCDCDFVDCLVNNAFSELITSEKYTYRAFINQVRENLKSADPEGWSSLIETSRLSCGDLRADLDRGLWWRKTKLYLQTSRSRLYNIIRALINVPARIVNKRM